MRTRLKNITEHDLKSTLVLNKNSPEEWGGIFVGYFAFTFCFTYIISAVASNFHHSGIKVFLILESIFAGSVPLLFLLRFVYNHILRSALKRKVLSVDPPLNPGARFCSHSFVAYNARNPSYYVVKFLYSAAKLSKYLCKQEEHVYSGRACEKCGKEKLEIAPQHAYFKPTHGLYNESFFNWKGITVECKDTAKYCQYILEKRSQKP